MKQLVLGILAHVDAGKTTLSEALLYRTGAIRDLGRVDHKNAQRIATALTGRNVPMYVPSPTNQIFPILSDAQIARLQEQVAFYTTARVDAAHQAVRFVTSWATTDAQVDALLAVLAQVLD